MFFSNRVVNAWNPLPNDVVLAPSLNPFKSRLNKFWHGHALKFTPSCYIPGETVSSAIRNIEMGLQKWYNRLTMVSRMVRNGKT